jgi:outer membrane protein TolC
MKPTSIRTPALLTGVILTGLSMLHLPPAVVAQGVLPAPGPAAPAPAPTMRRLTLEEARALALENNKSLALARLNVDEKSHATDAARKDYFPKLMGSLSYFHFNQDLGTVVTVQRGQLGILAPGTRTINAAVLNEDSVLSTVFVAQPITKLIAVNAAVQIARADQNSAAAQLDKGTRELLSGVAQAYHGLVGAKRIEAALVLQVGLLEQLLAAGPNAEVRVGLVETRQGLLEVRGQVRELTEVLNGLLDLPACTVLELVDPLPADLPPHCAEEAAQLALSCSPEVRDAQQGMAKAEAAMRVARMAYLPDVNVVGGFANQTVASYIQPDVGYVGIAGSITFWEWGKKRDLTRQREMDIALARQNVLVTMDKVQAEARKAYGALEQAREAHKLAADMVQARKEAEKAAAGAAVIAAKSDTAKAELALMKAEISYRVAHAQLAALVCTP